MPSLDAYIPDPALADKYVPREIGVSGILDIEIYEAAIFDGKRATLLTGPTGSGKTEGIRAVCAKHGIPMYIVQGSGGTTKEEFAGAPVVNSDPNDPRPFVNNPGPLVKMMLGHDANGGYDSKSQYEHTVFVLDEINAVSPRQLLWLNSINDGRRTLSLNEEQGTPVIVAHDGFSFFATMNEGHEYSGTKELNPAVRNRFNEFNVSYSHEAENALLGDIPWLIDVRNKLRDAMEHGSTGDGIRSTISTRALVTVKSNIQVYSKRFSEDKATEIAVTAFVNNCLPDDRQTIMQIITECRGGGRGYQQSV